MAIIDLVQWSPQGKSTIFAHKFNESNLSTYTQLVVQESQEAVLFSKGQIIGKFGPGKHTLNTENLPVLRHLFGIPFGGKNPFIAEVWFVNKIQPYNIPWDIDRMAIHDADYNTQLPLTAKGKYGLRVIDPEKFLIKIVGTRNDFTQDDLTEHFQGEFTTKTKTKILQHIQSNQIGYKSISASLDDISNQVRMSMIPFWDDLGMELTKFYITSIDIDESTPEGRRILDSITQQSTMSITGHTWQQEKMFGVANNAVDGLGEGTGGLIGGLLAINMMGGMGGSTGVGSGMMNPQYNQPTFGSNRTDMRGTNSELQSGQNQSIRDVYCSNCAKKFPSNHRFCPHCGDKYHPCPKCGTDNDANAKRCVSCGTLLLEEMGNCPHCNSSLIPGSSFCVNCGKQVVMSGQCSRCGTTLQANIKFCPSCGNKRQ